MGTTAVAPLKAGHDVRFEPIYEEYVRAWGDYDKADDPEDEAYYAGLIDAYHNVLVTFDAIEPLTDPTYTPTLVPGDTVSIV